MDESCVKWPHEQHGSHDMTEPEKLVLTFTAAQFRDAPGTIFRYVDRHGEARINHANYPDKIFTITARDKVRVIKRGE